MKRALFTRSLFLAFLVLTLGSATYASSGMDSGYHAPYAFDFGTTDSPVREWFKRVDPNTRYTSENGFGWKSCADIIGVSAHALREGKYDDYYRERIKPDTYLNDLTQDCVCGYKPAEFMVDLPRGSYEVYLLAGFAPQFPIRVANFQVIIGDKIRDSIHIPQLNIFEKRTYLVDVKNKPISIRINPETGWVLNALVVYPESEHIQALEQIHVIEQEIYLLPSEMWASWTRIPNPKPNPAPKASTADKKRGYIVFDPGYVENVYPDSAPLPEESRMKPSASRTEAT